MKEERQGSKDKGTVTEEEKGKERKKEIDTETGGGFESRSN